MIWETNGRYYYRSAEGERAKRISAERYRELSASAEEPSKPALSLSVPSFPVSSSFREEYARSFRKDKEEIRDLIRKRLEARGFEYKSGVPVRSKPEPEPEPEIEFEIDFEEDEDETEPPRLISLFSGIGADRAAIEGAETVLSCEIDKHAQRTYAKIWGDPPTHDDVTKIGALPPSDLLIAGFPCQPYSSAGKRKGLSDPRALIGKVLSLIEGQPPECVILENVRGILAPQGSDTLKMIQDRLSAIYPHIDIIESCASDFGPMRRPRVFIVASQRGWKAPPLPSPLPPLSAHLSASPEEEEKCRLGEATWECLKRHKEKHAARGNGFSYQWATENSVPTISARYFKDGSEALLCTSPFSSTPRRLHPRELSSLFGWGERWSSPCSNTQAAKQLGNSISIPQLRWIWEGVQ